MNTPNEQLLRAIAALNSTTHFQAFLDHLKKSHQQAVDGCVGARRGKDMRIMQGRARELAEILETCENAAAHIKAIERQQQISSEHLT